MALCRTLQYLPTALFFLNANCVVLFFEPVYIETFNEFGQALIKTQWLIR